MHARILSITALFVVSIGGWIARPAAADDDPNGQPYLGIQLGSVPKLLAMHLADQLDQGGLVIFGLDPDSPASAAGLQAGDVLVQFDGKPVADYDTLLERIAAAGADQQVQLKVIRAGKPLQVPVTLGQRPADFDPDRTVVPPSAFPDLGILPDLPIMPDPNRMQDVDQWPAMRQSLEQMNRTMQQMNRQFNRRFGQPASPGGAPRGSKSNSSSSSDSSGDSDNRSYQSSSAAESLTVNLRKIDGQRYRLTVHYQANGDQAEQLQLEGTLEQIRGEVQTQDDLPAKVRKEILQTLHPRKPDLSFDALPSAQELLRQLGDRSGQSDPLTLPKLPVNPLDRL